MKPIWSGSISFSLVNIPVKLYSAVGGERLSFDLLHARDLSPIRYARVCANEEEEVPYEEIVKGFEYEKGSYVVMEEEDFSKANVEKRSTIDIMRFVPEEEIDPIYFEKPYYLAPASGGEKSYAVLREALRSANKVAVATYVLRNREHPAILKAESEIIILNQMRYHDDLRDYRELNLPPTQTHKKEIEMALKLIEYLSGSFNPEDYSDTYKHELMRIIEEKAAGRVPAAIGTAPVPTEVKDLMAALKESLSQVRH